MRAFVDHVRSTGLGRLAAEYGAVVGLLLLVVWGVVRVWGLSILYVRLTAVFCFTALPMVLGLAWAVRRGGGRNGE